MKRKERWKGKKDGKERKLEKKEIWYVHTKRMNTERLPKAVGLFVMSVGLLNVGPSIGRYSRSRDEMEKSRLTD